MDRLGIYISVPFCRSKCSYCNFASGVYPESDHARYMEGITADLRAARARAAAVNAVLPGEVDSIYLGGGTPSILSPELLKQLFAALRHEFSVLTDAEVTLECAPGQLEDATLAAMAEVGVNRVSFGVQSFVDREAAVTGRLHTREVALADIDRVRGAGIARVNVDLIAGLPHQTAESWRESLAVLAGAGVDHASIYLLEVDDDSRLGRELLAGGRRYHAASVPGEEQMAEMYEDAIRFLAKNSLQQYEISNFARDLSESLHNCRYWRRRPYLGVGVDAHSMLRTEDGGAIRLATTDDLRVWMDGKTAPEGRRVSRAEELEEAWFLGLRMNAGVDRMELAREFGEEATAEHDTAVGELAGLGLLAREGSRIRLTDEGRLLSNEVFARFLADREEAGPSLVTVD